MSTADPRSSGHTSGALSSGGEMTFMEHLAELRKRLILVVLAVVIGAFAAYAWVQPIFELLTNPFFVAFPGQQLIGTGPAEALMLKIKVAVFAGTVLVSPFLFLQLWLFVAPGLYEAERRLVIPFVLTTSVLFIGGVFFCYHYILPITFAFFSEQYTSVSLTPAIRMSEHLSMMVETLLAFGGIFELPVIAFFLGRIGLVTAPMLLSGFRYAIVIIFTISAILTPPDVVSQFMMAMPLMVLYLLSIVIVRYTARPRAETVSAPAVPPLPPE